jgi:cytochrome c oxidase cbb3-type subunit III
MRGCQPQIIKEGQGGISRMNRLRDLAILAVVAGVAAYQGRQLHIYAATSQAPATTQNAGPSHGGNPATAPAPAAVTAGGSLFQQNCAFCHGRDAAGGETGPDLTRSKLVSADVGGDKIGDVVLHGRQEKGMPAFSNLSADQIASLVAFIHSQQIKAASPNGKRRGVEVADLQTGNVEAGKAYFNGPGGCATCHSPTGDLAGVATRYQGLQLEERMLYPRDVTSKVTVTLPSGETVSGNLAYQDEFTVGLRDAAGTYRSWRVSDVKVKVDSPVDAHVALFSKYTDDDIHNLMAYIQTLR